MDSRADAIPPDLFGRRDKDRFLTVMTGIADVYTRLLPRFGRVEEPEPVVDRELRLVVAQRRVEAEGVVSLTLAAAAGGELPRWQPGCHLDLHLASGLRRQYSLCGDPADRKHYRIAVRRLDAAGGGSREVHDVLTEGSPITVRGPRNAFPLVLTGPTLFLAGGIGITPILPMAREAARRGVDWRVVYTGRSRDSMPFQDELAQLAEMSGNHPDRVLVRPNDEFGIPDPAWLLADAPRGGAVYVCGPRRMLTGVRETFADCAATALHYERFSPPPVVDGTPFELELARSGTVLAVPADRPALDVLIDARPDVAYSCRQGFCGTCKVRVLAGEADHRDRRLTDDQRAAGDMLICVSRAHGDRLVLDL
ncbi:MAG TPA: PDR/VanB family oxidoreductase [Pseudonocardiaceae bacterium]|nr:PDR/VanB family oxidoreductase [Pseudonocardiaceae bacterium]